MISFFRTLIIHSDRLGIGIGNIGITSPSLSVRPPRARTSTRTLTQAHARTSSSRAVQSRNNILHQRIGTRMTSTSTSTGAAAGGNTNLQQVYDFEVSPVPVNPLGEGKWIKTAACLIIGYVSAAFSFILFHSFFLFVSGVAHVTMHNARVCVCSRILVIFLKIRFGMEDADL